MGKFHISVHSVCHNLGIITSYICTCICLEFFSCGDNSELFGRDIASHNYNASNVTPAAKQENLRNYLLGKFFILYGLTALLQFLDSLQNFQKLFQCKGFFHT